MKQKFFSWLVSALCSYLFLIPVTAVAEEHDLLPDETPYTLDWDILEAEVLELSPIKVNERVGDEDLGAGSFEETIALTNASNLSQAMEESTLAFGDPSSKGQRKLYLRGFNVRQIAVQFEDIPLDTGYDAIIGLDTIPLNWVGSLRIKTSHSGVFDELALGAGVELSAIEAPTLLANLGLEQTGFNLNLAHGGNAGPYRWMGTVGGVFSLGWPMSSQCNPSKYEDCGLRNNTDKTSGDFLIKAERSLGDWGSISLMSGWNRESKGVPTGIQTAVPRFWRYTEWDLAFAMLRLRTQTASWYTQTQVWFTYQSNTLDSYDDASYSTQYGVGGYTRTMRDMDVGLLSMGGTTPFVLAKAGMLDFRYKADLRFQYHDSLMHETVDEQEASDTSRVLIRVKPGMYWRILPELEFFADIGWVGNFELVKPENAVKNTKLQRQNDATFSLGMDYAAAKNLSLSLRFARRLRMPTLKEQFSQVFLGADTRDYVLRPEHNWDTQLQILYEPFVRWQLEATLYHSEIRDLIEFSSSDSGLRQAMNVDKARMLGSVIRTQLGPFYGLSFHAAYSYVFSRDLNEDRMLLERPAHSLRLGADFKHTYFSLGTLFQYESDRLSDDWTGSKYRTLGNVYLLSAYIAYHHPMVDLSLRATNLLDMHFQRSYGYPEPGRMFFLNANFTLD